MHFLTSLVPFVVPSIEIVIISFILYFLFSFFWNTRAMDLAVGIVVFLSIFLVSNWLHLPVIQSLFRYFVNAAVIGILIVFQPEIRIALSKLAMKGKKYEAQTELDRFLDSLTISVYRMSEKKIGALIVLENQDSLEELASKSVLLNAQFSSELLESIFMSYSPLHDGAVIIRGTTILAATVILPLADDTSQISRSMGTRHRAGLGITQHCDALSIVVSEETGKVSIAREGVMTKGIKSDRFKGILRSIFIEPESSPSIKSKIQDWLVAWNSSSKSSS